MIFVEVRCDVCGVVGASRRCFVAHLMRAELKRAGWAHSERGGRDICPRCIGPGAKRSDGKQLRGADA